RMTLGIGLEVLGLVVHELLVVRLVPGRARGVLVHPPPNWIEERAHLGEGEARARERVLVAVRGAPELEFDVPPERRLLGTTPAALLGVVVGVELVSDVGRNPVELGDAR